MSKPYETNEAFLSFQGEGLNVGKRTYFVRFSRCNIDCHFCDSMPDPEKPAKSDLQVLDKQGKPDRFVLPANYRGDLDGLIEYMKQNGLPEPSDAIDICFTGGEPTLYDLESLSNRLREMGFTGLHTVESNGLRAINWAHVKLWWTISPKLQIPAGNMKHSQIFIQFYREVFEQSKQWCRFGCFPGQLKFVVWLPEEGEFDPFTATEQFLDEVMEEIDPRWVKDHLIIQPEFSQVVPRLGTPEELEKVYSKYVINARAPQSQYVRTEAADYIINRWNWQKYPARFILQTHKYLGVR